MISGEERLRLLMSELWNNKRQTHGIPAREVEVCWVMCVIGGLQDVDVAANGASTMKLQEEQEGFNIIRNAKADAARSNTSNKQTSIPTWRKKINGCH